MEPRPLELLSKKTVVIGSLNNLASLCNWLVEQKRDVLVLASGWKDKFNLEDTICGGAITDMLIQSGQFISMKTAQLLQNSFIALLKKTCSLI